jgi:nucleoside-diphosphate-sugar epimerase
VKVLITGATGFLGSHLAELLREEGHHVRALVRKSSKVDLLKKWGAELIHGNLEKGIDLDKAVDGVDAVVHSAGVVKARSPEEFHEVNVQGTINLLAATKKHNPKVKRWVYVSSLAAHGFSPDGVPRACDAEARPVTHYGRSKLAGERAVLAEKDALPITVIRPPAIYGPRDQEMFAFFQLVSRRFAPFMGSDENKLSLVYARDCARALHLALTTEHPSGRVYSVEDGRIYTQRELADHISHALGVTALRLRVPIGVLSLAAYGSELYGRFRNQAVMLTRDKVNELREPYLICASEEIRKELGWKPEVTLEEGAMITAKWYREHGWL